MFFKLESCQETKSIFLTGSKNLPSCYAFLTTSILRLLASSVPTQTKSLTLLFAVKLLSLNLKNRNKVLFFNSFLCLCSQKFGRGLVVIFYLPPLIIIPNFSLKIAHFSKKIKKKYTKKKKTLNLRFFERFFEKHY